MKFTIKVWHQTTNAYVMTYHSLNGIQKETLRHIAIDMNEMFAITGQRLVAKIDEVIF